MAQSRNREKFLTGLIGAPIAQSAAPAMHEQAAAALGVRCHYQLIEVAGADAATLRALLENAAMEPRQICEVCQLLSVS